MNISTRSQSVSAIRKRFRGCIDHGREIYSLCAVCHAPEGWGTKDGYYPQVAGQHFMMTIKQLTDFLARNRDTPTMFPFTQLELMRPQDFVDVAAYLECLSMARENGVGPGTDLRHGKRLYEENCIDCHGENVQGIKEDFMTLIQDQHHKLARVNRVFLKNTYSTQPCSVFCV